MISSGEVTAVGIDQAASDAASLNVRGLRRRGTLRIAIGGPGTDAQYWIFLPQTTGSSA